MAFSIILLSKSVQRLHDINFPCIVILIPLILGFLGNSLNKIIFPLIVFGYHVHLMIRKGTVGPNKYGEDSLGTTDQTEEPIVDSE